MMKTVKFLLTILFLVCYVYANAQDTEYLLDSKRMKISGFGGPFVSFTAFEDNIAVMNGGGGAILLNQTFYFGGYGMGLSTDHERKDVPQYDYLDIDFGHGGLWFGFINNHHKLFHWGFSAKVGAGNFTLVDKDYHVDEDDEYANDHVFVMLPQAELEINFARWFKMNFGLGYQYMMGFNDDEFYTTNEGKKRQNFEGKNYNKPIATISFLFGGFGQKIDRPKTD